FGGGHFSTDLSHLFRNGYKTRLCWFALKFFHKRGMFPRTLSPPPAFLLAVAKWATHESASPARTVNSSATPPPRMQQTAAPDSQSSPRPARPPAPARDRRGWPLRSQCPPDRNVAASPPAPDRR